MKNLILLFAAALMAAACSSPKYAYHFDTHNYNAGKKKITNDQITAQLAEVEIEAQKNELTASPALTASTEVTVAEIKTNSIAEKAKVLATKYKDVNLTSKSVKKEFQRDIKELRKDLKQQIKATKKNPLSVDKTNVMDRDLKMAAIFGSVGLVLTFLGGVNSVFWVLGVIAIVVGVVFFIKWLARQ